MFDTLIIRNLALVTELELNFQKGFTVVTGETGAGKSLIFGALQLLLGGRADKSIIRRGATTCEISAIYNLQEIAAKRKSDIENFLTKFDIAESEEYNIVIRRVIGQTGSRCYVNGSSVTVNILKQLGELLVDFHGPNEQQSLFNSSMQLKFIDNFMPANDLRQKVSELWRTLKNKEKELQQLQESLLSESELDYVKFQLKEIDKANIVEGEDEEITAKHKILSSSKRLYELISISNDKLSNDNSIIEQLGEMLQSVQEIANIDEENGNEYVRNIEQCIGLLQELSRDLSSYSGRIDLDGEELSFIENRMNIIYKIKRKYGGDLTAVLEQASKWREQIDFADNQEETIYQYKKQIKTIEDEYYQECAKLTQERKQHAERMAKEITQKLHVLGFVQAKFDIEFKQGIPTNKGVDQVEYCFAPNIGEGLQPLRKIASSGEIARVMLAIKTVLGKEDHIPVLIFDEVDANIGGRVALDVAKEMKNLGKWHQIFSITHLAQIAAAGDNHYLVKKSVDNDRTLTTINVLNDEDRNDELMRMIGASNNSKAALQHVQEIRDYLK